MGQMRNATIENWPQHSGIKEATGDRRNLLQQISDMAVELIKVIELERSGIRDGDGYWSGSDAMGGTARRMAELCKNGAAPSTTLTNSKYDFD